MNEPPPHPTPSPPFTPLSLSSRDSPLRASFKLKVNAAPPGHRYSTLASILIFNTNHHQLYNDIDHMADGEYHDKEGEEKLGWCETLLSTPC